MIILGYHFDTEDLTRKQVEELEDSELWQGCYSTGCFEPTNGVLGVEMSDDNALFYPVEMRHIEADTGDLGTILKAFGKLSKTLRSKAKNAEPKVFCFTETDD